MMLRMCFRQSSKFDMYLKLHWWYVCMMLRMRFRQSFKFDKLYLKLHWPAMYDAQNAYIS